MTRPTVLLLGGPTASGKSGLALALADLLPVTIINCDAMQLYAPLPILTAQPTPAEQATQPHQLYGVLPAGETASAGRYVTMAEAAIMASLAAGRLPLLVGGSGLYFRALAEGIAPIPPVPAATRLAVQELRRQLGPADFHARLAEIDPVSAERLAPGDTQRVQRAFEVWQATGQPLSIWQQAAAANQQWDFRYCALLPERALVYAAINERFLGMLAAGALDEVRAARRIPGLLELPLGKAHGLRELAGYLDGHSSLATAIAQSQQVTRNYAKRQYTWFRHQWPASTLRLSAADAAALRDWLHPRRHP